MNKKLEIDRLVHQKVLGKKLDSPGANSFSQSWPAVPPYSANMANASEVVARVQNAGYEITTTNDGTNCVTRIFKGSADSKPLFVSTAPTEMESICIAGLEWAGIDTKGLL